MRSVARRNDHTWRTWAHCGSTRVFAADDNGTAALLGRQREFCLLWRRGLFTRGNKTASDWSGARRYNNDLTAWYQLHVGLCYWILDGDRQTYVVGRRIGVSLIFSYSARSAVDWMPDSCRLNVSSIEVRCCAFGHTSNRSIAFFD